MPGWCGVLFPLEVLCVFGDEELRRVLGKLRCQVEARKPLVGLKLKRIVLRVVVDQDWVLNPRHVAHRNPSRIRELGQTI